LREFRSFLTAASSGERGLGIEASHAGRQGVLRTHPVSRQVGASLSGEVDIPAGKRTRLALSVSNWPGADWRLVALVDGKTVREAIIGPESTHDGWLDLKVDLTPWAGQRVKLELRNEPNDWRYEFAYWDRPEILSE
jgi:hypothetical protein